MRAFPCLGMLATSSAAALLTLACGTSSATPSASGPLDDSGATDADGAVLVDAPAGACNATPDPVAGAQVQFVNGPPNGSMGGTIRDGLYELTSAVVYVPGVDAGPSIEGRSHAISIVGTQWASASYFDNAPTTRYTDVASVSGNALSLRRVCGPSSSGILFGAHGTYTATDSTVILNFPAGPSFSNGTAVLTFARGGQSDAGGACIGTRCSSSNDCCSDDAGVRPADIACGAGGTCGACSTNGLNDPCLGRPPSSPQGPDCCPGLRCINNRCIL